MLQGRREQTLGGRTRLSAASLFGRRTTYAVCRTRGTSPLASGSRPRWIRS